MMFRLQKSEEIEMETPVDNVKIYKTSSLDDLFQVILQGFLAAIIVEEKMGMEGNTFKKIEYRFRQFY